MRIRESVEADHASIFAMYKRVAATPGGLARLDYEIVPEYVGDFLHKAQTTGLSLVVESDDQIAGEIHAYPPGLFCFSHVWSDLTIAVDPSHQGKGIGRRLFESFMERVTGLPEVLRVELIVRESNENAIALYESLGFAREGRFERRIRNVDGTYEADIPMAWNRSAASPHSLESR